jgi:hypothetical protein
MAMQVRNLQVSEINWFFSKYFITISVRFFNQAWCIYYTMLPKDVWAGQRRRYSDWLRDGRSGDRIPVGVRFSPPVQTDPGAHPASCTMGTGSFPGVKSGRGMRLTPHLLLVPWSRKSRAIPLLPLWAVRTVQSLRAFTTVNFTFFYLLPKDVWLNSNWKW